MTGSRGMKRVRAAHILISAAITAVMLFVVFSEEQSEGFWQIVGSINGGGVVAYVLICFIVTGFRAIRYQLLLRATVGSVGTPSFVRLFLIATVRDALVDFLPARLGESIYIYFLHRSGVRLRTGALTFAFAILLDILVLLGIAAGLVFAYSAGRNESPPTAPVNGIDWTSASVFFLFVAAGLFAAAKFLSRAIRTAGRVVRLIRRRLSGGESRAARWLEQTESIASDMAHESATLAGNNSLLRLIHVTFWIRIGKYGSLYLLLLAVVAQWGLDSHTVPLFLSLIAFVSAEAVASLPISGLMGFGAYEGSWSWVLQSCGVLIPSTLKVAFIIHLITQLRAYSLAALAMLCLLYEETRNGQRRG